MWTPRDEALVSAAQEMGFLTPEQARDSKASFEAVLQAGMSVSLERLLLDKHFLSREQLKRVVRQLQSRGFHPTIGQYEILEKLGAGGSATVYKANDRKNARIVALKVLSRAMATDGETAERFLRGAKLAAKVQHPNIVRIYESGQHSRDCFVAMEYVEGTVLSRKARPDAPLSEREALELTKQIASALDACHKLGIVHRDVKPSNIIVTVSGLAKLTDLGIAREVKHGTDDVTLTGHSIGTPHYMSPEQCASSKDVDARSDIYSLGATLFFMLTGQPPFSGDSVFEVMKQQSSSQLPNPRKFNRHVSDMTHSLLWKMMSKTPAGRFQTAEELVAAIERVERMLPDRHGIADEMQELLSQIVEPTKRERLGRSILRRVKAIDNRLEAVKTFSAIWEKYAAFVNQAHKGAAFTAKDEEAFAALGSRISGEYTSVLPLLKSPERGGPVVQHCEQGVSLSATAQNRQSLAGLEKGCQSGAKLLHDFRVFLEQSRRKIISENFLRYHMAKFVGTPKRQIAAIVGLVCLVFLGCFLMAQLFGKAATLTNQQVIATTSPSSMRPTLAPPHNRPAQPTATKPAPATTTSPSSMRPTLAPPQNPPAQPTATKPAPAATAPQQTAALTPPPTAPVQARPEHNTPQTLLPTGWTARELAVLAKENSAAYPRTAVTSLTVNRKATVLWWIEDKYALARASAPRQYYFYDWHLVRLDLVSGEVLTVSAPSECFLARLCGVDSAGNAYALFITHGAPEKADDRRTSPGRNQTMQVSEERDFVRVDTSGNISILVNGDSSIWAYEGISNDGKSLVQTASGVNLCSSSGEMERIPAMTGSSHEFERNGIYPPLSIGPNGEIYFTVAPSGGVGILRNNVPITLIPGRHQSGGGQRAVNGNGDVVTSFFAEVILLSGGRTFVIKQSDKGGFTWSSGGIAVDDKRNVFLVSSDGGTWFYDLQKSELIPLFIPPMSIGSRAVTRMQWRTSSVDAVGNLYGCVLYEDGGKAIVRFSRPEARPSRGSVETPTAPSEPH